MNDSDLFMSMKYSQRLSSLVNIVMDTYKRPRRRRKWNKWL